MRALGLMRAAFNSTVRPVAAARSRAEPRQRRKKCGLVPIPLA